MNKIETDLYVEQIDNEVKKKNKIFSFFVKIIDKNYENNQIEDRAIAYNNAGNHYKNMGFHCDASKAYEKSAKLYDILPGQFIDAAEQYVNAAESSKKNGEIQKAKDFYNIATDRYREGLNFKKACVIYVCLGQIYENDNDIENSINMYEKALECNEMALECNEMDGSMSSANHGIKNKISIKLAELGIKGNDYKYSHGIYWDLINNSIRSNTGTDISFPHITYKINDLILKYILCDFILHIEMYNNVVMANHINCLIKKCNSLWASFEISNEHQLLIDCVYVCMNDDGYKMGMMIDEKKYTKIFSDPLTKKLFSDLIDLNNVMNEMMDVVDLS